MLLTIQKKEIVNKIYKGEYSVDFWQSDYALLSPRFTKGYNIVKKRLEDKTNSFFIDGESCYWGWVNNPHLDFFKSVKNPNDYIALFINIPDKDIVVSDYDRYTSYVLGESDSTDFIINEGDIVSQGSCLQCSFMNLNPESIVMQVPLFLLEGLKGNIDYIYSVASVRNLYLSSSKAMAC